MHDHSGNRFIFVVQTSLVVLCLTGVGIGQDSSFFNSNSQILKAFQDEMKTLEAAAHRVNSLFLNHASSGQQLSPEHQDPRDEQNGDNKNEPTNKDLEVTVLANPEILKNSQNQDQKSIKDSVTSAPEDKQKQPQHKGAESSFSPFGSFFNNYFYRQEPWWKGPHVCVDRTEKIIQKENGQDSKDHPESGFLIMGTGTFERCKQTSGKYVCTTVTNTPQESKTVTVTYQCCEGYHKQGRSCVEGEDSLEKIKVVEDDNSRGRNSISSSSSRDSSSSSSISHEADDKINMGHNYEKTVMRSPYVPVKVAVIKSENYPKQEDQRLTQDKQNQFRTHDDNVDTSYSSSSNEDVNLKPPQDVLEELGAKDFSVLLRTSGLEGSITSHNHTIFAPIDEAMEEYSDSFEESNQIQKRKRRRIDEPHAVERVGYETGNFKDSVPDNKDVINAHVIDSLMEIEDFANEMVLPTSGNVSTIRINIYPGRRSPVFTANCARFVSWDNLAVSSRIHTVDRVLNKVNKSVADILKQPQFSKFRTFLEENGLLSEIETLPTLTVFAPVNEAWDKLDEGMKEKYARGEACIDMVLKHHLLPLTLCLAPTHEGRLSTTDITGELITLEMDNKGDIIIDNKSRILYGDLVGTNGVVHALDKVLTPQSAKSVSDLLAYTNHTTWLNLLNNVGFAEEFNRASNMTLFVPSEQVLTNPATKAQLQSMDKETLKQTILYHAANTRSSTCDFKDSLEMESRLEGKKLRVHMIHTFPLFAGFDARTLVQCAPIIYADGKACHTVVHEIDRLLIPPNGTVLQQVASNPELSTFKRIIEGTKIENELEQQLIQNGEFTLLAPSNEAFNKLDDQKLTKLLTDKNYADQIVRRHVLPEPVCCSSVSSVPWPFTNTVITLQGRKIEVNRNKNNVLFGSSVAEQCDIMANDGIIHIVNSVLFPHTSKTKMGSIAFGTPNKQIFLYGI